MLKLLGGLLAIAGVGYVVNTIGPYFWAATDSRWTSITLLGEILFMIWLLAQGWRIRDADSLQGGRADAGASMEVHSAAHRGEDGYTRA